MSKQENIRVNQAPDTAPVSPNLSELSIQDKIQYLMQTLETIDMLDALTDEPLYQITLDRAREDIQRQAHTIIAELLPQYMPQPDEKLSIPDQLPPDAGLDYINRLIAGGHFQEIDPEKITFLKSMSLPDVIRFRIQAIDVQIADWTIINEDSDKSPGFANEDKSLLNRASEKMLQWLNAQKDIEAQRLL